MPEQAGRDDAAGLHARAAQRRDDAAVVDRVQDRLPDRQAERLDVELAEQVLPGRRADRADARVALERRPERRADLLDEGDLPGAQQLRGRGVLRHHAEHHLGEVRAGPAAPVLAELLQVDLELLALVPGLDGVRAGARVVPGVQPAEELGAAARGLSVVDVGGVVGRGLQGQRGRVAQVEDQRVLVGRVDRLDRGPDVGGAAVQLDGAQDRGLGRLRRHRPAGVEDHAVPEVEGPGLAAVRRRPAGREQRPDGVGGGVVAGERLVHLAHRDDAVGVLGGGVPAVHHHRGGGVVGEHLVDRLLRAGRAGRAGAGGQREDRHGGSRDCDQPSAMALHGCLRCALCLSRLPGEPEDGVPARRPGCLPP